MDGPLLVCNMFSFVFWKKLKTLKRHFEIIWHLVVTNSGRISCNLDLKNSTSVFLYCWRLLFVQCRYNKTCLEATLQIWIQFVRLRSILPLNKPTNIFWRILGRLKKLQNFLKSWSKKTLQVYFCTAGGCCSFNAGTIKLVLKQLCKYGFNSSG